MKELRSELGKQLICECTYVFHAPMQVHAYVQTKLPESSNLMYTIQTPTNGRLDADTSLGPCKRVHPWILL